MENKHILPMAYLRHRFFHLEPPAYSASLNSYTGSKMTLASLCGTQWAKGLNPFLECRRLLISPQA